MSGLVAEFGELDPGRPAEVLAQLELLRSQSLVAFLIADDEQLVFGRLSFSTSDDVTKWRSISAI